MSRTLRSRVLGAGVAPVLGSAALVAGFTAAAALRPRPPGEGIFREAAAYVAAALVVLVAARGAGESRRLSRRRGAGLAGAARAVSRDAGLAFLCCSPVLLAAWEWGGTSFLASVGGLVAATLCAGTCGLSLGRLGAAPPVATPIAAALGTLAVWPASLGWAPRIPQRFPAAESPPWFLGALLAATAIATLAAARGAASRAS